MKSNTKTEQFDLSVVEEILTRYDAEAKSIIAVLQEVQEHYHYLPREVFPCIAQTLKVSEARLYSVATFYENFSLEPKGHYIIKVCDGTACHLRHSIPILERLRSELGLSENQVTTDDLNFTVETVSCLGSCSLSPVLMVNEKVYPAMTPDKVSDLVLELKEGLKNA